MEVSVVWLGLAIIGITLLFLFTQAKGVYDTFQNYGSSSANKEGFVGGNTSDIRLIGCPADYKQFVNNDGQILCCDGTPNSGKCSGRTICSLSEGAGRLPTCSAWYTAYLDEKGRNKCPPSMPSYFESKDGKTKGCTAGARKQDGTGPLEGSAKFCRMYTSQREEEGKANSCSNVLLLDKTVCFPGTSVKTDKSLTEVLGGFLPARIQCSFGDPSLKTAGTCETDKSLDRFMSGVYTLLGIRGSWKESFMRWDPLDKINLCSITQKYKIDKTIGFSDLPNVSIDGKVISTGQPTPWKCIPGLNGPLRKNAKGEVECMAQDGKNCMWQNDEAHCKSLAANPIINLTPLSCGDMHKSMYGSTGYETEAHWCSQGRKQL